jgi:hypothetical protein
VGLMHQNLKKILEKQFYCKSRRAITSLPFKIIIIYKKTPMAILITQKITRKIFKKITKKRT